MSADKKTSKKTGGDKSKVSGTKTVNLALQGGASHGAFTWGVLDHMLSDPRVQIEGVSATSAGAVNASLMAYGLLKGGPEEARRLLRDFWRKTSHAASMLPFKPTMVDKMLGNTRLNFSPSFMALDFITRIFSPYQFNLFDINPLRSILSELVDFDVLRKKNPLQLYVNATNVRTGKIKVFESKELTLDMVMASCCLPFIFKTVYVDGEPYWDGGYSGNPAIYPLIYNATSRDVIIVQINPLLVEEVPTQASDILDRVNEISFNTTLMREMRAIAFVTKLIDDGTLQANGYKRMHMHMIEAQDIMAGLGSASKLNADWEFLLHLHDVGVQAANDWLDQHYDMLGNDSTIDIRTEFL